MSPMNDLDGPFGRTFSILGIVKQALIDSGRGYEAEEFLNEAMASDPDELKHLIGKYVDIDWAHLSLEEDLLEIHWLGPAILTAQLSTLCFCYWAAGYRAY